MAACSILGATLCAMLAGQPQLQTRQAAGDEFVQVAGAEHRSYRRYRYRSYRHRRSRVVVVYREKQQQVEQTPLPEPRPGPCASDPLVPKQVKTILIGTPAERVKDSFEELGIGALINLGRMQVRW